MDCKTISLLLARKLAEAACEYANHQTLLGHLDRQPFRLSFSPSYRKRREIIDKHQDAF
jgi:hypothetical protein